MRKFVSAVCLLLSGTCISATAQESEGNDHFNYSVFGAYSQYDIVNATQAQKTQQQAAALLPGWSATTDKLTGLFADMYGPAATVDGKDNYQKALQLMSGKLAAMGVNVAEWSKTRDVQLSHAAFVDFSRAVDGHKVLFSSLGFRFTTDGRLQRVKMRSYGTPENGVQPTVSKQDVLAGTALTQGIEGYNVDKKEVKDDWVWFPIPTQKGYVMHPAWPFHVTGIGEHEMPFDLDGYVDATNGELLYRTNSVNETFEVTVKANIHVASPMTPTTEVMMNAMTVKVGAQNLQTNDTGYIKANVSGPSSVTYELSGPWSRIKLSGSTPSFVQHNPNSPDVYHLPIQDTTSANFRAVSAFHYVNTVHDYMKGKFTNFTGMDANPLTTNVDIGTTTCNAYYTDGAYSINFYSPQTGCRAFSEVSDIVYHEYGHGISYRFYSANGTYFRNGAMGEANSDVWAMCINRDGIVGEGAFYNGGAIRNYTHSVQPKVYPENLVGEVHADGEILAGSWWYVALNTGSVDTMAKLFTQTYYDLPNGPTGTEGQVYHDVLISALMNDDDDANLGNGTPHFKAIVDAFASHGIYLLSDAQIDHTEVPNQPVNTPTDINAKLTLTNPAFFDKLYLVYRDRNGAGTWDTVAMNNTSGTNYNAQIPGFPGGTIVDYFFMANDVVDASSYGLPEGYEANGTSSEMTLPYQYGVGVNAIRVRQDFEGNLDGWKLGLPSDNATGGIWTQAVPIGTSDNGQPVQTGKDHTTGTGKCLVTGNSSSSVSGDDVDNGKTTVVTPYFDIPFYEPVIEYYRWYSNNRGSTSNRRTDYWMVDLQPKGSVLWRRVDYTRQSDQHWRRRIFKLSEFYSGQAPIMMRFTAEDRVIPNVTSNGQNVVEAAIDDFAIYEGAPLGVDNTNAVVKAEVYPNPADNKLNLVVAQGSKGTATLYDITGKVISVTQLSDEQTAYTINTAGLASGTYMVLIQTQNIIQNIKVAVTHQ